MIGTCRLNNKNMRSLRKEAVYQCLVVDLAMLGVISKEECEMLIGSGIPNGLVLPNGKAGNLISENKIPEQPVVTGDTEPGDTEPTETETNSDSDSDSDSTDEPETEGTTDDQGRTE